MPSSRSTMMPASLFSRTSSSPTPRSRPSTRISTSRPSPAIPLATSSRVSGLEDRLPGSLISRTHAHFQSLRIYTHTHIYCIYLLRFHLPPTPFSLSPVKYATEMHSISQLNRPERVQLSFRVTTTETKELPAGFPFITSWLSLSQPKEPS